MRSSEPEAADPESSGGAERPRASGTPDREAGRRGVGARLRALGRKLGAAQTALVLGLLYGLVGAPYALAVRLLGRDPLRPEPTGGSYWRDRPRKERTLGAYTRQY